MILAYRFQNVCIYDGEIQKDQNNRMYHLFLDLYVQVYDLRIWSAKSNPPMLWLYYN